MLQKGLVVIENGVKFLILLKFIIYVDLSGKNYKKKIFEVLNKVEELKLKIVVLLVLGIGVIFFLVIFMNIVYILKFKL